MEQRAKKEGDCKIINWHPTVEPLGARVAENSAAKYKTAEFNARYVSARTIKCTVVAAGETLQMYVLRALCACFSSHTLFLLAEYSRVIIRY